MGLDTPFMEAMDRLPDEHKRQAEEIRLANEECDSLKRQLKAARERFEQMRTAREATMPSTFELLPAPKDANADEPSPLRGHRIGYYGTLEGGDKLVVRDVDEVIDKP